MCYACALEGDNSFVAAFYVDSDRHIKPKFVFEFHVKVMDHCLRVDPDSFVFTWRKNEQFVLFL